MTQDRALARIMELHKTGLGDAVLRNKLRTTLSALCSASWSDGFDEGRAEEKEEPARMPAPGMRKPP